MRLMPAWKPDQVRTSQLAYPTRPMVRPILGLIPSPTQAQPRFSTLHMPVQPLTAGHGRQGTKPGRGPTTNFNMGLFVTMATGHWHNLVCGQWNPDTSMGLRRLDGWFGRFRLRARLAPGPQDEGRALHFLHPTASAMVWRRRTGHSCAQEILMTASDQNQ